MTHVQDDLELYALGALTADERGRIEAHLGECAACRAEAYALERVIATLQEELPAREPSADLRPRILASAQRPAPVLAPARSRWRWSPVPALAAASLALALVSTVSLLQVDSLRGQLDETRAIAERVSQGGDSWYMVGVDRWQGAGARLFVPQAAPAFVVFRGLEPAPIGQSYAIWLVDAEGRWIRGTSFNTDGGTTLVDVGVPVQGFDRCAVTLESGTEGKRGGPMVMQSRMYQ